MNIVAAVLYAMSSSVLLAIILALTKGNLTYGIAVASLAFGAFVAAVTLWQSRASALKMRKLSVWESAAIALFSLFSLRAFLWLVFADGDEIKVLSPNNLGDLSLHLTYINQVASGAPFWPENPIVAGASLTYPLGMDLFNSLLVVLGADPLRALIWVGLISCVLVGISIWRWGGAFTLFGFLCNGGLAGFVFFRTGELLDYQAELAWKSLPLALLVTQRGLLFALPAGLLLLCSWRSRYFGAESEKNWRLPYWGELLLYISLPVFHLHTFLFLSIVLLAWFIVRPEMRVPLARFVGLAFIPAAAFVFLVTGNLKGPSVIGWHPGWMQSDPDFIRTTAEQFGIDSRWFTIPFFWILNFGILPFLVAALVVRIARDPAKIWQRAIAFPAIGVFALCLLVRFAPWEWDNTKLMVWSYLAVLPILWTEILLRWPAWLRGLVCFALFWSGFISLLGGIDRSHQGYAIATRSELDQLAPALAEIPQGERFIAHPNYNHPLLLSGRPLILGYTGHVWSHGYEWQEAQARVTAILSGLDGWQELARGSGARYLFWGSQERDAYPKSPQPWRETAKRVATGEWGEIYDLQAGEE